jgi:hypothetical protein
MAKKLLVPVLPSDRFYDAVVAAATLLEAERGGLVVFLFTELRPPAQEYEDEPSGRPDLLEVEETVDVGPTDPEVEEWRQRQVAALDEARALLRDRGIDERNIDYAFADYALPRAEAIAEEAAAGGYDTVILPAGFVNDGSTNIEEEPPEEIPRQLRELGEVAVLVV